MGQEWDVGLFELGEKPLSTQTVKRKRRVNHRQLANRRFVNALKKEKACLHCGERRVELLDFHHKDPKTKIDNISKMVSQGVPHERLVDEMAKCVILCSNCHRKVENAKRTVE